MDVLLCYEIFARRRGFVGRSCARENGPVIRLLCGRFLGACGALLVLLLVCCTGGREAETPINVGLIAPLSGYLFPSGEAIQRGMLLAIDEVNRAGACSVDHLPWWWMMLKTIRRSAWPPCRRWCNGTGSSPCSPARSVQ